MSDAQEELKEQATSHIKKLDKKKSRFHWLSFLHRDPEDLPDGRFDTVRYESGQRFPMSLLIDWPLICVLVGSYRVGYPHWAAYQNSDPSFRIYKRFGTLRNRIILYRQQEIAQLEEELNRLDEEDHQSNNGKTQSLLWDKEEVDSKRMKLIDQIEEKLKNYGEPLLFLEQTLGHSQDFR